MPDACSTDGIKFEAEREPGGHWAVRSGDRYENELCPDEALWCIVRLMTGSGNTYLRTQAEHDSFNERYRGKPALEAYQKQLPAATGLTVTADRKGQ